MKVIYKQGDVLNPSTYLESEHTSQTINVVQGCNCLGVMGAGLAAQVKRDFNEAYQVYHQSCNVASNKADLLLGTITHYKYPNKLLTIINGIIQYDTGTDSRKANYEAVAKVFERIDAVVKNSDPDQLQIIAVPENFASGLAGGNWNIVLTIITETLKDNKNLILYVVSYKP